MARYRDVLSTRRPAAEGGRPWLNMDRGYPTIAPVRIASILSSIGTLSRATEHTMTYSFNAQTQTAEGSGGWRDAMPDLNSLLAAIRDLGGKP